MDLNAKRILGQPEFFLA